MIFFRPPKELTYDMLSQRQLMALKFKKHKLAVAASFLLAVLYTIALFSPFFAPYGKYDRNLDYSYCPPHRLGWDSRLGLHAKGVQRDIDPVTLQPVPDGELGELVLTTINREAMPLLRYRTRDLTRILPGTCPCGRTHRRIARLQGRSDDMIILKGVNIFPIQIEKILLKFQELSTDYLITLETTDAGDTMTIDVELGQLFTDDYRDLQRLERTVTRLLKDEILITPKVRFVQKGALAVSDEKKAVRVKDKRKLF